MPGWTHGVWSRVQNTNTHANTKHTQKQAANNTANILHNKNNQHFEYNSTVHPSIDNDVVDGESIERTTREAKPRVNTLRGGTRHHRSTPSKIWHATTSHQHHPPTNPYIFIPSISYIPVCNQAAACVRERETEEKKKKVN